MTGKSGKFSDMTLGHWESLRPSTKAKYAQESSKIPGDPLKKLLGDDIFEYRQRTEEELEEQRKAKRGRRRRFVSEDNNIDSENKSSFKGDINEIIKFLGDFKRTNDENHSKAQVEIRKLKAESHELRTESHELRTESTGLKSRVSELEEIIVELRTEITGLKSCVSELEETTSDLKMRHSNEIEALKNRLSEVEQQREADNKRLSEVEQQRDEFQCKYKELEDRYNELVNKTKNGLSNYFDEIVRQRYSEILSSTK